LFLPQKIKKIFVLEHDGFQSMLYYTKEEINQRAEYGAEMKGEAL
jgi:hypothetical protein